MTLVEMRTSRIVGAGLTVQMRPLRRHRVVRRRLNVTGLGAFVLSAGEPGIGKTTLLADTDAYARQTTACTAWGWVGRAMAHRRTRCGGPVLCELGSPIIVAAFPILRASGSHVD